MARPPITARGEALFRQQLQAALDWLEENSSGGGGGSSSWASITGKPSTFPPEAHTHAISEVTGLTAALATIPTIARGLVTVTVPNNALSHSETVTATGVTGSSRIFLSIAPHDDADENDAEMLDVAAMSAAPGSGQITVEMAFTTPTAGPIKINWMAA